VTAEASKNTPRSVVADPQVRPWLRRSTEFKDWTCLTSRNDFHGSACGRPAKYIVGFQTLLESHHTKGTFICEGWSSCAIPTHLARIMAEASISFGLWPSELWIGNVRGGLNLLMVRPDDNRLAEWLTAEPF